MAIIPLVGFSPDADPTTPGVLTDCNALLPSLVGMRSCPSLVSPLDVPALAAACKGAAVLTKLDGTRRVFAGTSSHLYDLSGGAWNSRGSGYTGNTDTQWSFAQFGDASLAANGLDTIQRSTSTTFSSIASAPIAEVVFSVGAFVMALNVDDGSAKPDGWHCCAAYDETDWVESTTTQCASGRLVSTPGRLTAGGRMGEYAIAYKTNSIYLGQYVGGDVVWDWQQIIGGAAGCVGKHAWADLDGTHFIVGEDNFWLFDGTRPMPLADGVLRKWFATACSSAYKYKVTCSYDKTENLVWIFFPSTNASTLDSAIVYHVLTKKFGKVAVNVEAVLQYVSPGITIDGMDALAATIDGLPDVPIDSPYWNSGARALSVFNTSHQMQTFSGVSGESSLMTGDFGDDGFYTLLQRVQCRFKTKPDDAELQAYKKSESGEDWETGAAATMTNGRFDLLQSAKWHRVQIVMDGNAEITGVGADYTQDGEE